MAYQFQYNIGDVVRKTVKWGDVEYKDPKIYGRGEFFSKKDDQVYPWYQVVSDTQPQQSNSGWIRAETVEGTPGERGCCPSPPPDCPTPPCDF